MQEWMGKRQVCFHNCNTILSGISKKLPPSEGNWTCKKSQAYIPFLVPDPALWPTPQKDDFVLLGISEAPIITLILKQVSAGSYLDGKNKPISILENNMGKFLKILQQGRMQADTKKPASTSWYKMGKDYEQELIQLLLIQEFRGLEFYRKKRDQTNLQWNANYHLLVWQIPRNWSRCVDSSGALRSVTGR